MNYESKSHFLSRSRGHKQRYLNLHQYILESGCRRFLFVESENKPASCATFFFLRLISKLGSAFWLFPKDIASCILAILKICIVVDFKEDDYLLLSIFGHPSSIVFTRNLALVASKLLVSNLNFYSKY